MKSQKSNIYIRRFQHDRTRFERPQQHARRGERIINVLHRLIYLTYPQIKRLDPMQK